MKKLAIFLLILVLSVVALATLRMTLKRTMSEPIKEIKIIYYGNVDLKRIQSFKILNIKWCLTTKSKGTLMNKAQAKIAIDALRSGTYTQYRNGIGNHNGNNLCCIGVAAKANGCEIFWDTTDAVRFLALGPDQSTKMIQMNDHDKLPFTIIADWMEKQEWPNE